MNPLDWLRVRARQGDPVVADLRAAVPTGFRGAPTLARTPCAEGCTACRDRCPTAALALDPVRLDLGRCVFCGDCAEVCPVGKVTFGADTRLATRAVEALTIGEGDGPREVALAPDLARLFGRSLRLRQVSAGGCNGCELELNALTNVNFDVQRYGIEWVASPRHADGLVLSGPLTGAMARALEATWSAMPEPRFLVVFGACAISGGVFAGSPALDRSFLDRVAPVLYVPGCPPHPLTFARALLDLLGR